MRKATGSYRTYSISGKTAALVPEFAVEYLPSVELQPRFLCLQNTLMTITSSGEKLGAKGDWDFRISDMIKNPDGTDI